MKLKDYNESSVNPDMIPVLNGSALNVEKLELTLILGNIRYCFLYGNEEDLRADFNAIKEIVDNK